MNPTALRLIHRFEGLRLAAYNDGLGVATIGYGTTHWPSGQHVKLGEHCTEPEAAEMCEAYINKELMPHLRTIPGWTAMSQGQQAALISFGYNLGNFYHAQGFDTLSRHLDNKDWDRVPSALLMYCNPNSAVSKGLLRRRLAECHEWVEGL